MSKYTNFSIRVYIEDTDCFGVVYHAKYINYYERGRTEWFRSQVRDLNFYLQKGCKFAVSKLNIDYFKPATFDESLIVHTELIKKKLYLYRFNQRIENNNKEMISQAMVDVISLDDNNQPAIV
jgi:acyl-CoA thioester hydrolase